MDTRNGNWFVQIAITGVGDALTHESSVAGLLSFALKELVSINPRTMSDGRKEIVIRISDKPYNSTKVTESHQEKIKAVEAGLDIDWERDAFKGPNEGESFEDYYQRALDFGLNPAAARWQTCDWFQLEQNPELVNWLADPKIARLLKLNSMDSEFQSATPEEYLSLKSWAISQYPSMVANLKWRIN